ncbi:MAG TPA: CopG family transcriptional regulator [Streptosporangiaceae bacterium]|nr:CopG family transcriptional regulator [Streptosporangiaceae bacterium]
MGSGEVKQFNVYLPVESELSLSSIVTEALGTHLDRAEGLEPGPEKREGN